MTSVRLREVKNKNKSLKVVAVTYKKWSLTRGSNYSDLTGDILVFWKSGSSSEAVAYERWSQGEVQLYEGKAGVSHGAKCLRKTWHACVSLLRCN